jgi:hypothetical protein
MTSSLGKICVGLALASTAKGVQLRAGALDDQKIESYLELERFKAHAANPFVPADFLADSWKRHASRREFENDVKEGNYRDVRRAAVKELQNYLQQLNKGLDDDEALREATYMLQDFQRDMLKKV